MCDESHSCCRCDTSASCDFSSFSFFLRMSSTEGHHHGLQPIYPGLPHRIRVWVCVEFIIHAPNAFNHKGYIYNVLRFQMFFCGRLCVYTFVDVVLARLAVLSVDVMGNFIVEYAFLLLEFCGFMWVNSVYIYIQFRVKRARHLTGHDHDMRLSSKGLLSISKTLMWFGIKTYWFYTIFVSHFDICSSMLRNGENHLI